VLEWDLLLDPDLAIPIEQKRVEEKRAKREEAKATSEDDASGDESQGHGNDDEDTDESSGHSGGTTDEPDDSEEPSVDIGALADTPWAEALRLGRRLAVTEGSYRLKLEIEGHTATRKFRVR